MFHSQESGSLLALERHKDPTLRPIRLGVCRDVVDEEARADEKNGLKQI